MRINIKNRILMSVPFLRTNRQKSLVCCNIFHSTPSKRLIRSMPTVESHKMSFRKIDRVTMTAEMIN